MLEKRSKGHAIKKNTKRKEDGGRVSIGQNRRQASAAIEPGCGGSVCSRIASRPIRVKERKQQLL